MIGSSVLSNVEEWVKYTRLLFGKPTYTWSIQRRGVLLISSDSDGGYNEWNGYDVDERVNGVNVINDSNDGIYKIK